MTNTKIYSSERSVVSNHKHSSWHITQKEKQRKNSWRQQLTYNWKIIWENTTAGLKCHLTVRCVWCSLQRMFDGHVYDPVTWHPIHKHEAWSDGGLRSATATYSAFINLFLLLTNPTECNLITLTYTPQSHIIRYHHVLAYKGIYPA